MRIAVISKTLQRVEHTILGRILKSPNSRSTVKSTVISMSFHVLFLAEYMQYMRKIMGGHDVFQDSKFERNTAIMLFHSHNSIDSAAMELIRD